MGKGFAAFLDDPVCTNLCQDYQDGKIRTQQELLNRLIENGKEISMPTLKKYLKEIKEVFLNANLYKKNLRQLRKLALERKRAPFYDGRAV